MHAHTVIHRSPRLLRALEEKLDLDLQDQSLVSSSRSPSDKLGCDNPRLQALVILQFGHVYGQHGRVFTTRIYTTECGVHSPDVFHTCAINQLEKWTNISSNLTSILFWHPYCIHTLQLIFLRDVDPSGPSKTPHNTLRSTSTYEKDEMRPACRSGPALMREHGPPTNTVSTCLCPGVWDSGHDREDRKRPHPETHGWNDVFKKTQCHTHVI